MSFQSKCWCFTAFAPDIFPENNINEKIKYICWQYEKCPTTGKIHQQGYLETHKKITLSGLKKITYSSTHYEPRRGTQKQAIEYCQKPGGSGFTEIGEKMEQGKRSDLIEFRNNILIKKKNEIEMIEDDTQIHNIARYPRLFDKLQQIKNKNTQKVPPFVWILNGNAETGKSKIANLIGDYTGSKYIMSGNYKWWEDYNHETICILDDYDNQLPEKDLLQLLDRYECRREKKCGHIYITSPIFIITCNDKTWIKTQACLRRITLISEL